MSEAKSGKTTKEQIPVSGPVVMIDRCVTEGCKKKPERANFCQEHFSWFKAGLVTKSGKKSPDFDRKYEHYVAKKAA